jgi:hypothetical protein
LATTVLESHHKKESLLEITNFLIEMTCSKSFDTGFLFSVLILAMLAPMLPQDRECEGIELCQTADRVMQKEVT